jgi:hypothetical protein
MEMARNRLSHQRLGLLAVDLGEINKSSPREKYHIDIVRMFTFFLS